MATPITNTFTTTDAEGERESICDIIARVDPVDTPVYSNSAKVPAINVLHQWQEWHIAVAPPVTVDFQVEGEEPENDVAQPTVMHDNPTGILARDYLVSGTLSVVNLAGRENEMAWSRITRALELRAEVETALLANNVKVATDSPREIAGLPTWADGGDGTVANSKTPAHTPAALETAATKTANVGVNARTLLMTPANKNVFSSTAHTGSGKDIEAKSTSRLPPFWMGGVSIYLSDQGPVQIVIDRYMDTTLDASFLMDERHVRIAEIQGRIFDESVLDPKGDHLRRLLCWEGTLEVGAPDAVQTLI